MLCVNYSIRGLKINALNAILRYAFSDDVSKVRNHMKKQIIAIGGGGLQIKNPSFEKYLISLTDKKFPRVCFLSQASNEAREYIVRFYEIFAQLDAQPSWLSLFGKVEGGWQEKLLEQDIIFVGGGNTRSMLALWREWGVDDLLRQAYHQGTILAGSSAGAICWFQQGITDSVWPLGILPGLGLLEGSCCPHYDSESERRPTYLAKTKTGEVMPGIALEDYTAAHFVDGELLRIVSVQKNKKAYRVDAGQERILVSEPI
jgi:peptidase E